MGVRVPDIERVIRAGPVVETVRIDGRAYRVDEVLDFQLGASIPMRSKDFLMVVLLDVVWECFFLLDERW